MMDEGSGLHLDPVVHSSPVSGCVIFFYVFLSVIVGPCLFLDKTKYLKAILLPLFTSLVH